MMSKFSSSAAQLSRRTFLVASGITSLGLAIGTPGPASAADPRPIPPVDIGKVDDGEVKFPAWSTETEPPDAGPPNPFPNDRRVGFAVVGLGKLALEQILPAFAQSKRAKLVALVSGTPSKLTTIAALYGVDESSCYSYEAFDTIRQNPAIEAVYVVLPNALHKEFVIRGAAAGKDILCEKPMATSSREARDMIKACQDAGRKLMIAYRIQYEPHTRAAIKLLRSGRLGKPQIIDTVNAQALGDASQWRLRAALSGGGSLPDIGLYCLNTARALLGEEPVEITATRYSPPDDPRFLEVEDTMSFMLRFPSGVIANCLSCYSAHQRRDYRVLGDKGWINMESAYAYQGQRMIVAKRDENAEALTEQQIGPANQFALELDHFSRCIRENITPRTPGQEGLQDQIIMEAIYEAARTRQPVFLPASPTCDATRGPSFEDD